MVFDYRLTDSQGRPRRLSALFGTHQTLILIHNMGSSCRYCSLWADGFNGLAKQFATLTAVVLSNHDSPAHQRAVARKRGWILPLVSVAGTSLTKDLGFGDDAQHAQPGASILSKDAEGVITRINRVRFGPGDNYCIMWDLMDLLPEAEPGRWQPLA